MSYWESYHPANEGESIEIAGNYLILRDTYINNTEVLHFDDIDITNLDKLLYLNINSNLIELGKLEATYDNRGEPYASGISLRIKDVYIFLDKRNISSFIEEIRKRKLNE